MTDPTNINEALLVLQADPPVLTKQKSGQVGNQKTKYADLPAVNAQVLTRLNALGVTWTCLPTLQEADASGPGRFVLRYELLHVASGTSKNGDYPLGAGEPQKMGSAITYARRYALLAVTGIAAEDEDDDGNAATVAQRKPRETKPKPEAATARVERAAKPTAPAGPPLPRETAAKPTGPTALMMTKLAVQFRELEVTDRGERLALIKDMVQRPVASAKDLTFDEARGIIDAIEKALKTDNPLTEMIEIYRRVNTDEAGISASAPAGRPAGQRSRNAAEAIGTGNYGDEQAPWEREEPVG
jgi:hypothetical protein